MGAPVLIALVIIAFFAIAGFRDGVVRRIVEICGVLVSLVLTARFATAVAPWVQDHTGVGEGPSLLITWAALFFTGLVLSRLIAIWLSKLIRLTILRGLDRWGGALVGAGLGTLVASVLLVAASSVPGGVALQESCERTPVGRFIFYAAPSLYTQARRLAGQDLDAVWNRALDSAREKADAGKEKLKRKADDALGR